MNRRTSTACVLLALVLASCTKEKPVPSPITPGSAGSGTEISPSPIKAGEYGYDASGVSATLEPKESAWALKVTNESGEKIGAPGVYALDASDGHRIDATVEGARPLEDGGSGSYQVIWPQDFDPKQSGMIILLVGEDMYGGFYLQT